MAELVAAPVEDAGRRERAAALHHRHAAGAAAAAGPAGIGDSRARLTLRTRLRGLQRAAVFAVNSVFSAIFERQLGCFTLRNAVFAAAKNGEKTDEKRL